MYAESASEFANKCVGLAAVLWSRFEVWYT